MREIIHSLPDQIRETINLIPNVYPKKKKFNKVLICGMGGSGISGEILAALYPGIQIITNKDYTIPDYIGEGTLAILISYSGNTEETLHNYRILSKRKIKMVLISSNGKLLHKRAEMKIKIPQGLPPRGALGYLFAPLPFILYKFHIIKINPKKKLISVAEFLKTERNNIEKEAEKLSERFINRLPVIYATSQLFAPVANRWRCQLNENSKILAHINIIPEMNHNEIVGLGRPEELNEKLLAIFLNDPQAHPRNRIRVRITKELIKDKLGNIIEVLPRGNNNLQRLFWMIMLGDFISFHLAMKTGINPMPVKRIEYLKQRLSKYK